MTVIGITRCLMTLWTLITNDINSNYSFMNKLHFNWILISDEIALIVLLFTKILINNDSNSNHELLNSFSLLGFSSVMTTLLNSFCLIRLCKMITVYSKYHFLYIILFFISLFVSLLFWTEYVWVFLSVPIQKIIITVCSQLLRSASHFHFVESHSSAFSNTDKREWKCTQSSA